MQIKKLLWPVVLVAMAGLWLAGCGTPTPVTCGVTSTGNPNLERMQTNFNTIVLISKTTGQPGQIGTDGAAIFAVDEPIQVRADAKTKGIMIRLCLQKMDSNGEIRYDQSVATVEGVNTYDIGGFQPGVYILRVTERNVLIANLPFNIK